MVGLDGVVAGSANALDKGRATVSKATTARSTKIFLENLIVYPPFLIYLLGIFYLSIVTGMSQVFNIFVILQTFISTEAVVLAGYFTRPT